MAPLLHPDRLLPSLPDTRAIARRLYDGIKDLPIVSPHGHTDPRWYAENEAFPDPSTLFVVPDHYIFRMLYSQGVDLLDLGVSAKDGSVPERDSRTIWHRFAAHYHLFRGTPTRVWCDHAFSTLFDLDVPLSAATADLYFDRISERLAQPAYRPRALFERFNIEVIATTESPLDPLKHHAAIRASGWSGRVVTAYRPDPVVDPDFDGFRDNLVAFGKISGCDTTTWTGYLAAHQNRRDYFKSFGATSSDHGHPTAATADLPLADAEALYQKVRKGPVSAAEAELFRAQMLTEMARMSLEDGLVMQIHPGSVRNIILFTLDETAYSRELAPLAGHYPCLRLGPPWWFFDSVEGMKRFREQAMETAGFYNTVGFNDDTRAFPSIPARHDVARRVDAGFLAELVADHRLREDEAHELAHDLTYRLVKDAYKL
ncbi:MAG: uronate isomerase [Rhizobiales bacterium]|nr:uronate isomerase [Hyphomicrobiales bacterium]